MEYEESKVDKSYVVLIFYSMYRKYSNQTGGPKYGIGPKSKKIKTGYEMVVCGWGQFWGVLEGIDEEQFKLLMKMSSLSYRV